MLRRETTGLVEQTRRGVSSTWINTEERTGASTFCYKQYSRAADTRCTLLHRVGPSCKGPRVDTGTSSLSFVLAPREDANRPSIGKEGSLDLVRDVSYPFPLTRCTFLSSSFRDTSGEAQHGRHSWICSLASEKICVRIPFLSSAISLLI